MKTNNAPNDGKAKKGFLTGRFAEAQARKGAFNSYLGSMNAKVSRAPAWKKATGRSGRG